MYIYTVYIIYTYINVYIYIYTSRSSKALVAKAHKVQDPVLGMVNHGTSVEVQNLRTEPIRQTGSTNKFAMENPPIFPGKYHQNGGYSMGYVSLEECRLVVFGTGDKQACEKLAKV